MNSTRFIHTLLIALVFYGQLAASVHVTDHLLDNHHESLQPTHELTVSDACSTVESHSLAELHHDSSDHHSSDHHSSDHASHHHHEHSYNPINSEAADSADHEKVDCIIYHLLLNLNGGFLQAKNLACAPNHTASNLVAATGKIVCTSYRKQQIRAPPVSS